jgi:hypothetical protein
MRNDRSSISFERPRALARGDSFSGKTEAVMSRIKIIGMVYLVLSLVGIVLYGALIAKFPIPVLKISAFFIVAGFLGVLAWVGFVMLKTPQMKSKNE